MMLSMPIIVAMLWGLYYAITEHGLNVINVPTLYFIGGFASIAFSMFVSKTTAIPLNFDFIQSYKTLGLVAAIVLLACMADVGSLFAMKGFSASYAAIGECIYPVFVPVFAYLIFQKLDFTPMQMVGAVIIMIGVGLVVYGQISVSEEGQELATELAGANLNSGKS